MRGNLDFVGKHSEAQVIIADRLGLMVLLDHELGEVFGRSATWNLWSFGGFWWILDPPFWGWSWLRFGSWPRELDKNWTLEMPQKTRWAWRDLKLEARDQWFLKSMETITNIHPFPIAITDIQSLSQSGLCFCLFQFRCRCRCRKHTSFWCFCSRVGLQWDSRILMNSRIASSFCAWWAWREVHVSQFNVAFRNWKKR